MEYASKKELKMMKQER